MRNVSASTLVYGPTGSGKTSLLHWVGVAVIMGGIALLAEGEEH